ncbi:MAG: response regulator [Planctomycetota bacterium]
MWFGGSLLKADTVSMSVWILLLTVLSRPLRHKAAQQAVCVERLVCSCRHCRYHLAVLITEVGNDEKKQLDIREGRGRILVVDGHPAACRELTQLVNQEAGLRVCAQANNTAQAFGSLDVQQFDLAIVGINMSSRNTVKLADQIRMRCLSLPLLKLSIQHEALKAARAARAQVGEYIINRKAAQKIVEAVRYVQSLLNSGFCGFTILVEVDRKERASA